jgi:hypothetical protein
MVAIAAVRPWFCTDRALLLTQLWLLVNDERVVRIGVLESFIDHACCAQSVIGRDFDFEHHRLANMKRWHGSLLLRRVIEKDRGGAWHKFEDGRPSPRILGHRKSFPEV